MTLIVKQMEIEDKLDALPLRENAKIITFVKLTVGKDSPDELDIFL